MSAADRLSLKSGNTHVFTCAECGKTAATIELVLAETVDHGPGPTEEYIVLPNTDGGTVRMTWLAIASRHASPKLASMLGGSAPIDPLVLQKIDYELGAFCCRHCEANYCTSCWKRWVVFADDYPGWYEETRGRCPRGHEQMLDD